VRGWSVEDLSGLGLSGRGLDGSPEIPRAVVQIRTRFPSQYSEGRLRALAFPLQQGALAATQALGVGPEGGVTGLVRKVALAPDAAEAMRSDRSRVLLGSRRWTAMWPAHCTFSLRLVTP
jgi:hypothetical protein